MLYFEKKFKRKGYAFIIGVDEAGRGPLAGPVVAAAVFLRKNSFCNRIDDSKKLSQAQREKAFREISNNSLYGLGIISEKIIDRLNIRVATKIAMENAVKSLIKKAKFFDLSGVYILVDGDVGLDIDLPVETITSGDSRSLTIACASIIAKVTRDRIMDAYDRIYPGYGFFRHKGYPTKIHRDRLKSLGPSKIHRLTFYGV